MRHEPGVTENLRTDSQTWATMPARQRLLPVVVTTPGRVVTLRGSSFARSEPAIWSTAPVGVH